MLLLTVQLLGLVSSFHDLSNSLKDGKDIHFFLKRKNLSENEIHFLKDLFERKTYTDKEVVLRKGEICKNLYYVERGILKTSFLNEDGKEFINGIAIENNFCTSVASYTNQIASSEEIVALEDCEIYAISIENFNLLLQ